MKRIIAIPIILAAALLFLGLSTAFIPKGASAVKGFNKEKYLGTWYEIARLDYKWEKNLNNVSATYTMRSSGKINVKNRGYNTEKKQWEESVGKAKPLGAADVGSLEVSFFGPFYAEYNIIALDKDYKYALVVGENTDYIWFLSREKTMPESIKSDYLQKAKDLGYATEKLIWVQQDEKPPVY